MKSYHELPAMQDHLYSPILYLLYKKNVISENELTEFIATDLNVDSVYKMLDIVDRCIEDPEQAYLQAERAGLQQY